MPTTDEFKKLIGAKDVEVSIVFSNSQKKFGVAQGVGINLGQTVDRLIVLGSKATLPFAGYYMAQITFRKFFMANSTADDLQATEDLQSNLLPNPLENVTMTLKAEDKTLVITISKAFWSAKSITVQAGQVLVFEDVTFECEDITFLEQNK
ncbi:MAG: hypothetical protein QXE80_03255 [Pyrobaculum sp.]